VSLVLRLTGVNKFDRLGGAKCAELLAWCVGPSSALSECVTNANVGRNLE